MKFSKNTWNEFMNEARDEAPDLVKDKDFSEYERDDMGTDHKMVFLLEEILSQLKTLNHYMTPAKDLGGSGVEKAIADLTVAENVKTPKKQ